jgi:gliding motility-associated lipoprotein GldK
MGMYIPAEQNPLGVKELDKSKLLYKYTSYDYNAAAQHPDQPRSNFVASHTIGIYPDTTVWVRQFSYANNDPIAQQYFWFQGFDEYPVVGVNWFQANAFCDWRTRLWKSYRESHKMYLEGQFQLPTETEWEWAARGGRQLSPYPWGGPYVLNKKGCYLANFKPMRGDYSADGGLYTVKVKSYWANDYGLYNMSGNVAEWTSTPYVNQAYNISIYADINPNIKSRIEENTPQWQRRIVVKGGSWRDPAYFLNVNVRDYEFADTSKAYIGFRCVYREINPVLTNEHMGKKK